MSIYTATMERVEEPELTEKEISLEIARTILNQLQHGETDSGTKGRVAMMCWGVNAIKTMKSGLSFKIKGAKIKGYVAIEYLAGHDHYDIKIYNTHKNLKEHFEGAYCMDLVELIDSAVES